MEDWKKEGFASEEALALELQELYRRFGYKKFKMSRFEEYDLYLQNKNFLVCDNVITFNDTNGRLMALKPDVTLSIVKNSAGTENTLEKVYYNENVYRVSARTHEFKELTQTGLECIGDVDLYVMGEVILLAAKSLGLISDHYILDISHMGIVSGMLDEMQCGDQAKGELLPLIGRKNIDDILRCCERNGIAGEDARKLAELAGLYGPFQQVLNTIKTICTGPKTAGAVEELDGIYRILDSAGCADHIHLDFSIVNDMSYYNGVIFQGFIEGIPGGVLSGGRYDRLLHRMGKSAGAIGFAVYVDMLEYIHHEAGKNDVDVLLLYGEHTDPARIAAEAERLISAGESVRASKTEDSIRFGRKITL